MNGLDKCQGSGVELELTKGGITMSEATSANSAEQEVLKEIMDNRFSLEFDTSVGWVLCTEIKDGVTFNFNEGGVGEYVAYTVDSSLVKGYTRWASDVAPTRANLIEAYEASIEYYRHR